MGGKSKAPKTPDYSGLAKEQAVEDRKTAQELTAANRPNQIDAFGNRITWTQDPSGAWTQQQTFNPATQQQFTQQVGNANTAGQMYGTALQGLQGQGAFQAPNMPKYNPYLANQGRGLYDKTMAGVMGQGEFSSADMPTYDPNSGREVADATYGLMTDRLLPQQQKDTSALTNKLRMQGLQPGTRAFDDAMQNMLTSQGDVLSGAANQATLSGYNEANRRYLTELQGQGQQFGQDMATYKLPWEQLGAASNNLAQGTDIANAQYEAQLRGQGQDFGQRLTEYQMPWQQAGQLAGLASDRYAPSMPGFSGATGYNPTDIMGAANAGYNADMGKFNAGQNKKGGLLGAGAQLGSAALMASDETLKADIAPLNGRAALDAILALGGYTYSWKDSGKEDIGVIAQEVEKILPELINRDEAWLRVNYTGLVALSVEAIKYLAGELRQAT